MMSGRSKKPSWFKLWLHHKPLLDAVPDDVAGRAVKAALHYFATGEDTQLGQLEMVVFASLKSDIDKAYADYLRDVENGKKGGRPKVAAEEKPSVRAANPSVPSVTEGDGERDGERDGEGDGEKDGKGSKLEQPPVPTYFSPPTPDEVRAYCTESGYTLDANRFVDYYTSNGWRVGKNPMKDWKAACRSWASKDKVEVHGDRESGIDRLARMFKEEFGE